MLPQRPKLEEPMQQCLAETLPPTPSGTDDGQCWRSGKGVGVPLSAFRGLIFPTGVLRKPAVVNQEKARKAPVTAPPRSTRVPGAALAWSWTGPRSVRLWSFSWDSNRLELLETHPDITSRSQGARIGAMRRRRLLSTLGWPDMQNIARDNLTSTSLQRWSDWEYRATHEYRRNEVH